MLALPGSRWTKRRRRAGAAAVARCVDFFTVTTTTVQHRSIYPLLSRHMRSQAHIELAVPYSNSD
jgi:hypothetical protein